MHEQQHYKIWPHYTALNLYLVHYSKRIPTGLDTIERVYNSYGTLQSALQVDHG